jgi:hypothetical protein
VKKELVLWDPLGISIPELAISQTSSLLKEFQKVNGVHSFLESDALETTEKTKGVKTHVIYEGLGIIDFGSVSFEGFKEEENGWVGNFKLLPEGVEMPLPVGDFHFYCPVQQNTPQEL